MKMSLGKQLAVFAAAVALLLTPSLVMQVWAEDSSKVEATEAKESRCDDRAKAAQSCPFSWKEGKTSQTAKKDGCCPSDAKATAAVADGEKEVDATLAVLGSEKDAKAACSLANKSACDASKAGCDKAGATSAVMTAGAEGAACSAVKAVDVAKSGCDGTSATSAVMSAGEESGACAVDKAADVAKSCCPGDKAACETALTADASSCDASKKAACAAKAGCGAPQNAVDVENEPAAEPVKVAETTEGALVETSTD